MTLILAALAVFFVWESTLSISPWTIWPWLQPFLVYAASLAFCWPDWRTALAAAGAVGILHTVLRLESGSATAAVTVQRPRRGVPPLP